MSVLVYTENWDGKFKKLTFELASYASELAKMLGSTATALSIGTADEEELKKLSQYGISRVIHVSAESLKHFDPQAYTRVIAKVAKNEGTKTLVMADNNSGRALAPRLSVALKAAVGSGANSLPLGTDPFVVSKKVFSGSAYAHLLLKTDLKILTLAQNSFDIQENIVDLTIEKADLSVDRDGVKTQIMEVEKQGGKILLNDAEIVVSGGRGMKSADNWGPIMELAELLGAATACSRPVSDEGWRPHEEHTGQTGKIIAPNLYIAIGISGATQHLAGISGSKYIVAINPDKDAPIFEAAQYGIVGDASKILPKLVEAVKQIKSR